MPREVVLPIDLMEVDSEVLLPLQVPPDWELLLATLASAVDCHPGLAQQDSNNLPPAHSLHNRLRKEAFKGHRQDKCLHHQVVRRQTTFGTMDRELCLLG